MERLLSKKCECLRQATAYRVELETIHGNYEHLLDQLGRQITDYETLFSHVKVQFVGKELKDLKKEVSAEMPAFPVLVQNIRLAYGTKT